MALKAAYSFDAGDSRDDSGNGHDGTLTNTPTFPNGKNNGGLRLTRAETEYVRIADHADFHPGQTMTLMYWCYIVSTPTALGWNGVGKNGQWYDSFYLDGGVNIRHSYGHIRAAGGYMANLSTQFFSLAKWTHIALRLDTSRGTGDIFELIVNGVKDSGSGNAGDVATNSVNDWGPGYWDGTETPDIIYDDIRFYDNWFTEAEIAALMLQPVLQPPWLTRKTQPQLVYLRKNR